LVTIATNAQCSVTCSISGDGDSAPTQGAITTTGSFTTYPNFSESYNEEAWAGSNGANNGIQFMYIATFTGLAQYKRYNYQCNLNGQQGASAQITFPKKRDSVRIVAVGDIDWQIGNVTANYVVENINNYDVFVAMGDYAYDLCNYGNSFMTSMIPLTSALPFMVAAGNHEGNSHCGNANKQSDFIDYINRFNMPMKDKSHNLWFSYDVGNVHFASITTELFQLGGDSAAAKKLTVYPLVAELGDPAAVLKAMLDWLNTDLAASTKKWKVIYFHRPYYTNFWKAKKGAKPENDKNQMAAATIRPLVEPIALANKVDLVLTGDVHGSERIKPMINGAIAVDGDQSTYNNINAPVYLVCGNAGEKGNPTGVKYPKKEKWVWKDASVWTDSKHHGYCDITFTADTISYQFINTDDKDRGQVLDKFVLTKTTSTTNFVQKKQHFLKRN